MQLAQHNQDTQSVSNIAIVFIAGYIAAQMLSDVASLKIGVVGGWAVDMGTFIYPLTFTIRDVIHKLLGKRVAQTVIFTAAAVNVVMALYLMFAAWVPSDPGWAMATPTDLSIAFTAIFTPVWRIVLASILAELISELLDTEIYHRFTLRFQKKHLWARVVVSNAISVPIDSLLFSLVAFAGILPWVGVWEIFIFNMVVKTTMTLVSIPLIYLGPDPRVDPR
jgi:uncharacterized integral membrane protein (TIGR00697 family)